MDESSVTRTTEYDAHVPNATTIEAHIDQTDQYGAPIRAKLQIYCSPDVAEQVRELARGEHVTIAELVRKALSLYRYALRNAKAGNTIYVGRDGEILAEVLVP